MGHALSNSSVSTPEGFTLCGLAQKTLSASLTKIFEFLTPKVEVRVGK